MPIKLFLIITIIGFSLTAIIYSQSPRSIKDKPPLPASPPNSPDVAFYPAQFAANTLAILLHGGSWVAGDKVQLFEVGQYLSKQGIAVLNLNYRLAPLWHFDAPLQDIAVLIRHVDQDPAAYGLNRHYRLVLLGFSAGAHLATQFCLTESTYAVRQTDVCIGLAGIYDLDRIRQRQDGLLLTEAVDDFLGTASARQASPLYRISSDEPTRFLLVRGEDDKVVSPDQMTSFSAALRQHRIVVDTLVVPGKDHLAIFKTIPHGDDIAQKIIEIIRQ